MNERQQWRRYVLPEIRIQLRQRNDFEEIEERVDGKPKPYVVNLFEMFMRCA